VATVIFVSIYGLLFLASSTAFNSIIATSVLFLNITFAVPQAFAAARGREKHLPSRPLNLGRHGYFVNIFSTILTVLIVILACFPPILPVFTENMNYSSVIVVGIFSALTILWFTIGNRTFVGPKLDMDSPNSE
jgi:choline transport protein